MATDPASALAALAERAGMWFVEVSPAATGAAPITLAFDGEDLATVTVGRPRFELFPFGDAASVAHLADLLQAVVAGDFEGAGTGDRTSGRINTGGGTVRVGHVGLPLPWRVRRPRRFLAYSG